MIKQSEEVKRYFDTLKLNLQKDAEQFEADFDAYRKGFYETNKWTDALLMFSAQTTHFNQEAEWSLDRLQATISNIGDLIKANAGLPSEFKLDQENIGKNRSWTALTQSKALAAAVIFEVIAAAMKGVGGKTTASLTNEKQQGIIGKGYASHTMVAARSYTDQHYFGSITIVGYAIRSELWFSQQQAAAEANISWVATEMRKSEQLERSIEALDSDFDQGALTYAEWKQQRELMSIDSKAIKGELSAKLVSANRAFVY